jgi:hypothetical protein
VFSELRLEGILRSPYSLGPTPSAVLRPSRAGSSGLRHRENPSPTGQEIRILKNLYQK